MSMFKVPLVPQWSLMNCCVSTPDGGFLYIGLRTINYISMIKNNTGPLYKIFHTRQKIISLDSDPDWSGKRYFAVLAQDNSVQIWDFDKCAAVFGHKAHFAISRTEGYGPSTYKIIMSYMCNRNVLSMDSMGDIVIYCVASNTFCRRSSMIPSKFQLTVLKCSPFNENIFAVGTNRGLVMVANLKSNQIVHSLRGHEGIITSLSWSIIVHKEKGTNKQKLDSGKTAADAKKTEHTANPAGGDDIFDIYDFDYLENEFGAPCDTNSKENTEDFPGVDKPQEENVKFDFVEACQNLKEDITALKENVLDISEDGANANELDEQVTLHDCQQMKNDKALSSSCPSSEGSVELIDKSSSDNDTNREKVILHEAEVYAVNTPTVPSSTNFHNQTDVTVSSDIKSPTDKDIILASSGVDDFICIWNTETGSICHQIKMRQGNSNYKNARTSVCWWNSTTLLANDRSGDIKSWSLIPPNCTEGTPNRIFKFKQDNKNFPQHCVASFSLCPVSRTLWAVSTFRELSCADVVEEKIIAKYSCSSISTAVIKECPDDMNKIALGFSDRRIGIIDISKISPTNVNIDCFSSKIDAPVLSLAWSPNNRLLAYGTCEGRLGILNTEKQKNNPFLMNQFSGNPIYSIDWKGKYIYACCNDKIALYETNMTNKDPYVLEDIANVSALSVHGDFLFVGTQRGHLQIYRQKDNSAKNCELMQEIEIAPRYISDINWSLINPTYFAVASNSNKIFVFEFNEKEAIAKVVREIVIKNVKAANACIKWSNSNKDIFLTCGFDGAIRIWDLSSTKTEEKFLKQFHCPMLCGVFLPTDENIVICAGKSTSLETFDMRKEAIEYYSPPKSLKKNSTNTLDNVQWATKFIAPTDTKKSNKQKNKKNNSVTAVADATSATAAATTEVVIGNDAQNSVASLIDKLKLNEGEKERVQLCKSKEPLSIYMKNPSTLLCLTTKEINKDALDKITFLLKNSNKNHNRFTESTMVCVKLFGNKSDALKLLEEEYRNQQLSAETKTIANIFMPQIRSNLKDEIIKCIQMKQLNEWHVSLAPSVSYNFWKKCSQAYGEQLLEQGHVIQAATYFLATHKVMETVNLLREKQFFKEALLIAKVYCQPDDPIVNVITDEWIAYQEFTGNLSSAALLCVLSGQPTKGYEILSKVRTTLPEFEKVVELLKSKA